jgi:hypothetical protein
MRLVDIYVNAAQAHVREDIIEEVLGLHGGRHRVERIETPLRDPIRDHSRRQRTTPSRPSWIEFISPGFALAW